MKNFFRKYWTHIINIIFFLSFIIFFILLLNTNISEKIGMGFVIIAMLYVALIWFEIIYHIILAVKNKDDKNNSLHAVFCYLFNLFYIPCYRLQYIVKDEKYKIKNIIYLVVSILLYILMFVSIFISAFLYEYNKVNTKHSNSIYSDVYYTKRYIYNGKIAITLPNTYKEETSYDYDYAAQDDDSFIGIYVYDENYSLTSDAILNHFSEEILKNRENAKVNGDDSYKLNDREIKYKIMEGTYENSEKVYVIATITFDKDPNYVLYAIQITHKEDYSSNKKDIKKILEGFYLTY